MKYLSMGIAWGILVLLGSSAFGATPELDNPQLSVSRSTGAVLLSWPDWATNWAVEQSADLRRSATWTPLAAGTNKLRRNIDTATNGYFRLRKLSPAVAGLSGYWKFDEGTGVTAGDEVPNAPPVFFTNATWGSGRVGPKALRFNGGSSPAAATRAWATNSNFSVLPANGQPFSISLWFSPEVITNGSQALLANGSWRLNLQTPSLGTNNIVFNSGSLNLSTRTLLLPGQWYELVLTYDGANVKVFLDANQIANGFGSVTNDNGQILVGGGIAGSSSFWGRIDEVRAYKTALTDERISLSGAWSFDESVGTVAYDRSIFGHHGRLSAPAWTPGKLASAVQVSSNEVVIDNQNCTVLPPSGGSFSISMWIYPDSLPVGRSGLMSATDTTNTYWELALDVDASRQTSISFKSATGIGTLNLNSPVALSERTWSKLDVTFNGGIATLYVNGRQVHHDSGAIQGSRAPIHVGQVPGTSNFDGAIDELRIYRRERAASEIGPVAAIMWETVFRGSTTNILLQGSGPAGKTLTYAILDTLTPTNGLLSHSGGSSTITYQAGMRKGPDALVYSVSDGEFTSMPATLILSVVEPHWISTNGGSIQPLDGASPEHAWAAPNSTAVDAMWKTNNYYDSFFYAPGIYETTGWKYQVRSTASPGCKHIGSGSDGPTKTTIKLVGTWDAWGEGYIFGQEYPPILTDGFEVHNMLLDCNADNNPKYSQGEPVWIRVPLKGTSLVQSVTLQWNTQSVPSVSNIPWNLGAAREFRVCSRVPGPAGYTTNCISRVSTGAVDIVQVGALTDEILIWLDRRVTGANFYSISELAVVGAQISLPTATLPGGAESRLQAGNPSYSILRAFDQNVGTSWASGLETTVEIRVPVDPSSPITSLKLHWNCEILTSGLELGAATEYSIKARNRTTGAFEDVLFTRAPQTPEGEDLNTFTPLQTDELAVILTSKEPGVSAYSLREVFVSNNAGSAAQRIPSAFNALYSTMQAFDGAPETAWASNTQGAIGAIATTGSNMKFTRLKVIGFGTKAGKECFVFWVSHQVLNPPIGNILAEDCLFTEPATNNTEGVSVFMLLGREGRLTNGVARRCTVRDIQRHFRASNGLQASLMENCVVENCQQGAYFEPDTFFDDAGPIVMRSNRFINVFNGIWFLFHPGRRFDSITAIGNEFVFSTGGGWGVAACDVCQSGESGVINASTLIGNIFRYSDWRPQPGYPGGAILYSDIKTAVYANNVAALGATWSLAVRQCPAGWVTPPPPLPLCPPPPPSTEQPHPAQCLEPLPAGYRRAWINNRGLSGDLIPIRFENNGVPGLSSQQQRPAEVP